jgi:hypothetical protein
LIDIETTIEKLEDQLKRNRPEKRNADIQSYIDKIDVLRDENEALKLSIQATLDSKQQDLKMYQHLLDNARREIENE